MSRSDTAIRYHAEKNNCAASVLKANSDLTGLDMKTAGAITNGFGGGLRSGEVCGCISGGVMAIGLAAEKKGITVIAPLITEFVNAFREKFGAVRCADLKAKGISCDELIGYTAELTEEFINKLN